MSAFLFPCSCKQVMGAQRAILASHLVTTHRRLAVLALMLAVLVLRLRWVLAGVVVVAARVQ